MIRFFVRSPHLVILTVVSVFLIGISALPYLSINQNPQIEFPILDIHLSYPNASKQVINNQVLSPLIPLLKQNKAITNSQFTIRDGQLNGELNLAFGADTTDQYWDIRAKLDDIQQRLPPDAVLDLQQRQISQWVVPFVIAVSPTHQAVPTRQLVALAQEIKSKLASVRGVSDVRVLVPDTMVSVMVDPDQMRRNAITLSDITAALSHGNTYHPKGDLSIANQFVSIEVPHLFKSVPDIGRATVFNQLGEATRLSDIAAVSVRPRSNWISQINGTPAVLVEVKLSDKTNIFFVKKEIQGVLDTLKHRTDIKTKFAYDESHLVKNRLNDLGFNLISGIALLAITLLFTVGYRSTFVVSLLLPLSILFSLALLVVLGIGIQQVVIAGFIISLGLVVDPGIVLAEESKLLQHSHGLSRRDAAIQAAVSMAPSLITSSLTTILGFAPIFFMQSEEGVYLRTLAIAVWLSIVASLVVSLMVITLILAHTGTDATIKGAPKIPSVLDRLSGFRDTRYAQYIRIISKYPGRVLAVSLLIFCGIFSVNTSIPTTLFPPVDDPYFYINVGMPPGTPFHETHSLVSKIESQLLKDPTVKWVSSTVGHPYPMVNISMVQPPNGPEYAQIFVQLTTLDLPTKRRVMQNIDHQFQSMVLDATVVARTFAYMKEKYPADINVLVHHVSQGQALTLARRIEQAVATQPWVSDIENRPSNLPTYLEFRPRLAWIQATGVPRNEVDFAVIAAAAGQSTIQFQSETGDTFPVVLQFKNRSQSPLGLYQDIQLVSPQLMQFPLSSFIAVGFQSRAPEWVYDDYNPTVRLGVNVVPTQDPKVAKKELVKALQSLKMPDGGWVSYRGIIETESEIFAGFSEYAGFFLVIMFAIFVIQFNSFSAPLLIFMSAPYSIFGSLLLLKLTGQPFTFLTYVGLIGLIGIAVNDAILFVAEANIVRDQEHKPVADAVVESGKRRFRPMILTSLTTFIGLTPLAVGNTMFKPLAIVIMGGLVSSTLYALLVLPAYYAWMGRRLRWDKPNP